MTVISTDNVFLVAAQLGPEHILFRVFLLLFIPVIFMDFYCLFIWFFWGVYLVLWFLLLCWCLIIFKIVYLLLHALNSLFFRIDLIFILHNFFCKSFKLICNDCYQLSFLNSFLLQTLDFLRILFDHQVFSINLDFLPLNLFL